MSELLRTINEEGKIEVVHDFDRQTLTIFALILFFSLLSALLIYGKLN
jgi:hypothetical protein